MKHVYMVTYGDYSDYTVCAVFTTREQARRFCDTWPEDRWDSPRIEDMLLDPVDVQLHDKAFFGRVIPETGEIYDVAPYSPAYGLMNSEFSPCAKGHYYTIVFSKNAEYATKAIADKWRAWRATHGL